MAKQFPLFQPGVVVKISIMMAAVLLLLRDTGFPRSVLYSLPLRFKELTPAIQEHRMVGPVPTTGKTGLFTGSEPKSIR